MWIPELNPAQRKTPESSKYHQVSSICALCKTNSRFVCSSIISLCTEKSFHAKLHAEICLFSVLLTQKQTPHQTPCAIFLGIISTPHTGTHPSWSSTLKQAYHRCAVVFLEQKTQWESTASCDNQFRKNQHEWKDTKDKLKKTIWIIFRAGEEL